MTAAVAAFDDELIASCRRVSIRPGRILGLDGTVFRPVGRAGPGRARF